MTDQMEILLEDGALLQDIIDRSRDTLSHHGVIGMKWGVRNAPKDRMASDYKPPKSETLDEEDSSSSNNGGGGGGGGGAGAKEEEEELLDDEEDEPGVGEVEIVKDAEWHARQKMIDEFLKSKGRKEGKEGAAGKGGSKGGKGGGSGKKKGGSGGSKKSATKDSDSTTSSTKKETSRASISFPKSSHPLRKNLETAAKDTIKSVLETAPVIRNQPSPSESSKTSSSSTASDKADAVANTTTTQALPEIIKESAASSTVTSIVKEAVDAVENKKDGAGTVKHNDLDIVSHLEISTETREKAAEKGEALPDGSYPIRNKGDLSRAIQSFGRASNKAKVKRWIIKRARELDAVDLLPEGWGVDELEHTLESELTMNDLESVVSFEEPNDSELARVLTHYGVMGMKWGVRNDRSSRANLAAGKPQTGAKRPRAPQATIAKRQTRSSKESGNDEGSNNSKSTASNNDGRMSDDQLRSAINRMQLEKQYSQLMAERAPKRTEPVIRKIIADSAKQAAGQILTQTATQVGKYAIAAAISKSNPTLANSILKVTGNKKDSSNNSDNSDDSSDTPTFEKASQNRSNSKSSNPASNSSKHNKAVENAYDRAYSNSSSATQSIINDLIKLRS